MVGATRIASMKVCRLTGPSVGDPVVFPSRRPTARTPLVVHNNEILPCRNPHSRTLTHDTQYELHVLYYVRLPGTGNHWLADPSEMREELIRKMEALRLEDAVDLVGFVQHEDLAAWYARADVFVLPTLEDTYGVVLAEAAAYGLPIVTTPFAGTTAEVVREGLNDIVADSRYPGQFAQSILAVWSNKERLASMGRSGLEVARGLGPDVAAPRIAEAVRLALGRVG